MKLGRYYHFKGKYYVVIGVGKRADLDSDEYFVTYVSEADMQVWVRSLANFEEYIDSPLVSYKGPRFMKVADSWENLLLLEKLRGLKV